jgi:integrase
VKAAPRAFCISPRDSIAEQKAELRASRKTPTTSQMRARDAKAARAEPHVGESYDVSTYRRAIHRACDRAGVPRWSPHRLRHAAGTRAFLKAGLEGTQTLLGHADLRTAKRYSEAGKTAKLADLVRRLG